MAIGAGELRAEKRGAYYALAKNPDKYVQYQQAQQQTEDEDHPTNAEDKKTIERDKDDDDENDQQQVIHLWAPLTPIPYYYNDEKSTLLKMATVW